MVVLHGFCSYAHYCDFFARNLMSDYHVVAPDMRGHGDSSRATCYTLEDGALDLGEFIAALKLNDVILIGVSMGGLISLLYTAKNQSSVSKLVVVDIGPELATAGMEHIQKDLAGEPEYFNSEDEAFRYLKRVQPLGSDAFNMHQVKYALKRDEAGRLRFKYDRALCRSDLESQEWLWDYLEQIKCPTLIVRAVDSDMLTVETAQKMLTKLPKGSLAEITHAGHALVGDNPEAFEMAVRKFLGATNQ
jgi:pimeloyl-ACP methyl ester carboxylesterase